jgi:hypothetical protein
MQFRLLAMLTILLGISAPLLGQDITGTWQGTLKTPARDLRVVFKITSAPDNKFTGQTFSIDQGGQPIPISAISVVGRKVNLTIAALNATYDGTFEADGNAIEGTLTQGAAPLPLHLDRATPQTAWAIPAPPQQPKRMDPEAKPDIEVSTVRLSPPGARGRLFTMRGTQVMAMNVSVRNLLKSMKEIAISAHPSPDELGICDGDLNTAQKVMVHPSAQKVGYKFNARSALRPKVLLIDWLPGPTFIYAMNSCSVFQYDLMIIA